MKTKIFVPFFIAITILLSVSCGKKSGNHNDTAIETTKIEQQQEINPVSTQNPIIENDILKTIDSLAKIQVDTTLLMTVSEGNQPFNLFDWEKVKKAFQQWRKDEISKGYYVESCLENPEVFIEKYGDKWMTDSLRYALPNMPKKINAEFDTCKTDINFDGKQDVLFKILPIDCIEGNGLAAHPPLYITVLSKGNNYIVDNTCIHKIEKTIRNFRGKLSNEEYQYVSIDKIKNEKGMIAVFGHSSIYMDSDASCCPSIEYNFTAYMDKTTKGYIQIIGVYKNELEKTADKFTLKLRIE